ncbi:hypothetical protein CONPUDRAFT_151613 [Coniophora puteana RWD-64-598 SS2]|uniref:F-box domain-containing protein n=1 Tax=Coniophora puteana (strain RWD-64-598) TaxID=741705 RepID=A0A5M3MZP2_CONPW|nr:uncharacterized protein CONPUDRAFT_151613 [Coniophora puteana RWD-64-598 SS2]EIW84599.1 hypothetical protein CONPUDRAFT_151613 [Coniophora puteana RWD-64-598 SS2]
MNVLVAEELVLPRDTESFFLKSPTLTDFFARQPCSTWPLQPFSHPKLERVAVHCSSAYVADFMSATTLPSLTDLAVSSISYHDSKMEDVLNGLVHRSGCRLRRLNILNGWSHEKRLLEQHKISKALAIPVVNCELDWDNMTMMHELKTEWYEREYFVEPKP